MTTTAKTAITAVSALALVGASALAVSAAVPQEKEGENIIEKILPDQEKPKFEKVDTDKSGDLTLEETRAVEPDLTEKAYTAYDTDESGALEKPEYETVVAALTREKPLQFAEADVDQSGDLSMDEAAMAGPTVKEDEIKRADTNADEKISEAEYIRLSRAIIAAQMSKTG